MSIPLLLSLLLVAAPQQSTASDAAGKFALDLPTDDTVAAPAEPVAKATGRFSLDTPIAELIANPAAKAILDRDLPGLSEDDNLPKFKALSLRKMAPLSGGQMTPALLTKVETDLTAIDATPAPVKKVQSRKALPSGR